MFTWDKVGHYYMVAGTVAGKKDKIKQSLQVKFGIDRH